MSLGDQHRVERLRGREIHFSLPLSKFQSQVRVVVVDSVRLVTVELGQILRAIKQRGYNNALNNSLYRGDFFNLLGPI
jgi:hypothetical protein